MRYASTQCKMTEEYEPEHVYVYSGVCLVTGKPYSVRVPAEELFRYNQGEKIQNALKSVSADDREFLMTGFSPEGWTQVFGEEE